MRERTYKIYLTDVLRLISENTAKIGGGTTMTRRWVDIAEAQEKHLSAQDNRSVEQIIADVAEKAGLIITHG